MDRQTAENTITEYLKPVFGFTLKRCRTIEDADDLSQEILLKAFRALLIKDDINDSCRPHHHAGAGEDRGAGQP